MAKFIVILSLIVAATVLFYFQNDLRAGLKNLDTPITPSAETVSIRHSFKDGIHLYAGAIRLPHSCYGVTVDARRDPENPSKVLVTLQTRDGMTDDDLRLCFKLPTSYPFETLADAPLGAELVLLVDDKEIPTRILETPWHDPRGTILNLEKI